MDSTESVLFDFADGTSVPWRAVAIAAFTTSYGRSPRCREPSRRPGFLSTRPGIPAIRVPSI